MPVNSINSISFSGKNLEKKEAKKVRKEQYFRWVSQNQANDALKLSLGREVEDGKHKAAEAGLAVVSMLGTLASLVIKSNVIDKLSYGEQYTKKLINQNKAANFGFIASAVALIASNIVKNHNIMQADKTANERGFLSTKDRMKMKSAESNYIITDEIYNSHVS